MYRIRILESNSAGYLDFFGFGLDIVSLSTGSGLSKWNKYWPCKKSWLWNSSCMRKNFNISKSYYKKPTCLISLARLQCSLLLEILSFRLRISHATCCLELCEDEHDWFYCIIMTQPVVTQMRHVSFLKYI